MLPSKALRIFPRNCPPTPTGELSRDSSGDKRHLHVSCLTPRLEGSASRWILTDLHRAKTPYQYRFHSEPPRLVPAIVRSTVSAKSKTPKHFAGARPLAWAITQSVRKDFVTTQAPTKHSGVRPDTDGCHTDSEMIMSADRLCKPYWLSSRANGG